MDLGLKRSSLGVLLISFLYQPHVLISVRERLYDTYGRPLDDPSAISISVSIVWLLSWVVMAFSGVVPCIVIFERLMASLTFYISEFCSFIEYCMSLVQSERVLGWLQCRADFSHQFQAALENYGYKLELSEQPEAVLKQPKQFTQSWDKESRWGT